MSADALRGEDRGRGVDPELSGWTPASGPATDRLASLIAMHDRDLLRVAVAISDDAQRARQAVQATWAWARRRADTLGGGSEARARLLRRVAREAGRRTRPPWPARLRDRLHPSRAPAPEPAHDPALGRVLATLTTEDRGMLALRHAVGLTTDEVAAQLDLTGPGVRAHLDDLGGRLRSVLEIPGTDGAGTPLSDREVELRIAARLVAHLDDRAGAPTPREPVAAGPSIAERLSRLPRLGRGRIAVAAVVMLAVVAVALPLSLVPPAGPASTAPTPAPGTLLPIPGWDQRPLGSAELLARIIGWAPDGGHVAVAEGGITIYDRSGDTVRSFGGDDAVWLDADRLLVLQSVGEVGVSSSNLTLRSVSGGGELLVSLDTLGPATELVGGPSGSVALLRTAAYVAPAAGTTTSPVQFLILNGGLLSEPLDGIPLAWTGDGAHLAVLERPWPSVGRYRGVLHVLDVLDARIVRDRDLGISVEQAAFSATDASGRYLLACLSPSARDDACVVGLVDLQSGTAQASSIPGWGAVASWAADGSVLIHQGGTLFRWTSESSPVALRWQPETSSPLLGMTPAGSGIVVGLLHGPLVGQQVAGSEPPLVIVPGLSVRSLAASPDGTRLAWVETHLGTSTIRLASLPAPGPTASATPRASASATPPAGAGPTLEGLPLVTLAEEWSQAIPDADLDASWGSRVYLHTGGDWYEFEDGPPTFLPVELLMLDLANGTSTVIESPLADDEDLELMQTDGGYLVLEAFRRLAPPGDDSSACPQEFTRPMAWRLLAAPLGSDGLPSGPFEVLDSGTASRVFTPVDEEGPDCPATVLPAVAVRNDAVAYAIEAPSPGNPWASRIILRGLSDGATLRSETTRAPIAAVVLDDGLLAWTERQDVSVPSDATTVLRMIAPLGAPVRTVSLSTVGAEPQWGGLTAAGGFLVYAAWHPGGMAPPSVWMLDPSGTAQQISPAGSECYLGAAGGGMAILGCSDLPAGLSLIWRPNQGLTILEETGFGGATIAGGWIVVSDWVWGWGGSLSGIPLAELLP